MTEFSSHQPTLEILFQVYVRLLCDESNIEKKGKNNRKNFYCNYLAENFVDIYGQVC